MASPAERSTMSSSSKYDDKSPPLYPSTDHFNPLGFSTPQQQQREHSSQPRNYYSAQPKYMLPRSRGFHNRHRGCQNEYQDRSPNAAQEPDYNNPQGNLYPNAGRSNYNRNWRGNQTRNQRFGGHKHQHHFRQKDQGRDTFYNIEAYFHPSMLEDPWEFLLRRNAETNERTERSMAPESTFDANVGAGDSSNSANEG